MGSVGTPLALGAAALPSLAADGIAVPTYDRAALQPRIVHIGVGGFHRAHMALYTHELAQGGGTWAIQGLGLLPADAAMAGVLAAQDHLYTLIERGPDQPTVQVVGSLVDHRATADHPDAAIAVLADPAVAVVSLTITEAGYTESDGDSPDTFTVLTAALERRRAGGHEPLTVLSCDNLPGNGAVARRATERAARRHGPALGSWIDVHCRFPNSMVDRITPVTTDDDRAWLRQHAGIDDGWPVVAEPFRQWVIEDDFAGERPRWEDVGVLFADDVHAWELYKLRLLNAGHSSMAYLCALAGITFVDEAMADTGVRSFVTTLLHDEAIPTLTEIPGHRREDYAATVLARFANTGVRDQIARLCIDGSAKFPTFLLPTIAQQLAVGGPIARGCLALAGWARYLVEIPEDHQAFDASATLARRHARRAVAEPARFLDYAEVFPATLRDDHRFRLAFEVAYERIGAVGPHAAMADA